MRSALLSQAPAARVSNPVEVVVQNPCQYRDASVRRLRPWIESLAERLSGGGASLTVRFVSDREIRQLNRVYRGKDSPTDVLSFPGEASPDGRHLGDVVISVPTARRQALTASHSVERELQVLMLHGLLHCLGYDHEVDNGEMEALEHRLRREWVADA